MPAYITLAECKALSPSPTSSPSASRDTQWQDVIDSVMARIDSRTGQYLASGYTGTAEVDVSELNITKQGYTYLYIPRMESLTKLEYAALPTDDWREIDTGMYKTGLQFPHKWSGIDTIYAEGIMYGTFRLTGNVGWGIADDDTVPADLKLEATKQCRYDYSRLAIGGTSGSTINSGDMAVEMDGWSWLLSMNAVIRRLIDPRRLIA